MKHPAFIAYEKASTQAYKGYLIEFNGLQNMWRVSKEGFHIGWYQTLTEAKRDTDNLVD